MIVAAATSSIAWLLDPAIKKIFLEKDQKLIWIIPLAIIIAFSAKGISLYLAKVIMIGVAEDIKKNIQKDMILVWSKQIHQLLIISIQENLFQP